MPPLSLLLLSWTTGLAGGASIAGGVLGTDSNPSLSCSGRSWVLPPAGPQEWARAEEGVETSRLYLEDRDQETQAVASGPRRVSLQGLPASLV